MPSDFVSSSSLLASVGALPTDSLNHQKLAQVIFERMKILAPGSVLAIQGEWGRGKTDVLLRLAGIAADKDTPVIWINPWQYGTPDLLTPLVVSMLDHVPKERNTTELATAVHTVVQAGIAFGLKAAAIAAVGPAGTAVTPIADSLAKYVVQNIPRLKTPDEKPVVDAVAKMAASFRVIVEAIKTKDELEAGGRIVVCVDDIDRCLPERQVTLLEGLRFLTTAESGASIVIAIDPHLARQSVLARYKSETLDPERYLNKLFDLRMTLPALGQEHLREYVRSSLAQKAGSDPASIGEVLDRAYADADVAQILSNCLTTPSLRNPRLIAKLTRKLYILARESVFDPVGNQSLLLHWLALGEAWPCIRQLVQGAGTAEEARHELYDAWKWCGDENQDVNSTNVRIMMPKRGSKEALEINHAFHTSIGEKLNANTEAIFMIEKRLRDAGL